MVITKEDKIVIESLYETKGYGMWTLLWMSLISVKQNLQIEIVRDNFFLHFNNNNSICIAPLSPKIHRRWWHQVNTVWTDGTVLTCS